MHVTVLRASNATQYKAIMLHAYEHAADAFTSTPAEREREPDNWWIDRISDPTGLKIAFGVFDGSVLVGTAALEFSAKRKTRHKALIIGMYVLPEWRKNGIARTLVRAAIDYCRMREGIRAIQLEATEGTIPAIALYRDLGFIEFGVEPLGLLTESGYRSKLHMWLELQGSKNAG